MAFWNSVKKAFGFSADEEDEFEEEYDSSLPTYAAGNHRGEAPKQRMLPYPQPNGARVLPRFRLKKTALPRQPAAIRASPAISSTP